MDRDFTAWVLILTVLCLWPVWSLQLPPMQDYSQHLFIAKVLATTENIQFNWSQFYDVSPNWGSYALAYTLTSSIGRVAGIEAAGKLLTSFYIVLMAWLVLRAARGCSDRHAPWPLLIVFAFAFNQVYFFGFQSYLLSIPVLFLALMELNDFALQPVNPKSCLRLCSWLALLFFAHPYSVLVFLGLGAFIGIAWWSDRHARLRVAVPLAVLALIFVTWYVAGAIQPSPQKYDWGIRWLDSKSTAAFFALMFTGMHWFDGIDPYTFLPWLALAGLSGFCATRYWAQWNMPYGLLMLLTLTMIAYALLPFWLGYYSYFNLRLAPVVYVFAVLSLASVPTPRIAGHGIGIMVLILVLVSASQQSRITQETTSILPVLDHMEKNAPVLPVLINTASAELDPQYFYQFHAHDHYYYHLRVGGGVNPLQFPSPLLPVQLKANLELPLLDSTPPARWAWVIAQYRYILVRGGDPGLLRVLRRLAQQRIASGPWVLFENLGWSSEASSELKH